MSILWPFKRKTPPTEPDSPALTQAKLALAATNIELAQAEGRRAVSQARRITLADIRRNNHFTPSIFPEVK